MPVQTIGDPRFPRFVIYYVGRWWAGCEWTEDHSKALVFADRAAADAEYEALRKKIEAQQHEVEVIIPVSVTATTPWPVDCRELVERIKQIVRVECTDPLTPDIALHGIDVRWGEAKPQAAGRRLILEDWGSLGGPDEGSDLHFHLAQPFWLELRQLVPLEEEVDITAERANQLADVFESELQDGQWQERLMQWGDGENEVVWALLCFLRQGGFTVVEAKG